jgi:EmrB/QacA subfamily drug resistance transporter
MDTSRSKAGALTTRAMWAVLAVVIIADVMDLLDATITNIAAPSIVRDLGGGEMLVKWLGSSYALALGVLLVMGGRLGDRYGQRRLFLVGIAGFTIASLACGLSFGPVMLITARLCQGAFGALLIPQGVAIMMAHFSREMMDKAFSMFGPALGLAMVGGPILAGFLIDANIAGTGWRAMFLINLVLGTAGFIAALRVLPRDAGDRRVILDGLGVGLLAATMFGLLFGLIEGSSHAWTTLPIVSIAVGLVAFVAFSYRQKTAKNPLIKPSLLANRGFTSGLIMGLALFTVISGLFYVIALFLQLGLGLTPARAALGLAPVAVGIIAASGVAMKLIAKLGRVLIFFGLLISLAGVGWLLALVLGQGMSVGSWSLAPPLLVMGFGMGACFGTLFDVALGDVRPDEAGSASGSLSAVQQLAAAIGAAAMTTVYFQTLAASGQAHAMAVSLVIVGVVTVLCCGLVWLLPRAAQVESGEAEGHSGDAPALEASGNPSRGIAGSPAEHVRQN